MAGPNSRFSPRVTRARAAAARAAPPVASPPCPADSTAGPSTSLAPVGPSSPVRPASPEAMSALSKRRRTTLRPRPRGASASAAEPILVPASTPPPPRAASDAASEPSGRAPLEALFLGSAPSSQVSGPLAPLSPPRSPVYAPLSPPPVQVDPALASEPRSPSYSPPSPTAEGMAAAAEEARVSRERRAAAVGLSLGEQLERWGEVYAFPSPTSAASDGVEVALDVPAPSVNPSDGVKVVVPAVPGRTGPSGPFGRAATPAFERDVQRLTPPPRWEVPRTPSPPPPDHRKPSHAEIIGWSGQYEVADLLVRVAEGRYPRNWDVAAGSNAKQRLQRIVMMRLTEGCMPWPSWQCRRCADLGVPCFPSAFPNPYGERSRLPRVCTHCHLADVGNCERSVRAFPGMEYPGDGTPTGRSRQRAERANLSVAGAPGPGPTRSYDRMTVPTETFGWTVATRRVFRIRTARLRLPLLRVMLRFSDCWHSLYSERQPHESVAVSGGAPDPIDEYVFPPGPNDGSYIDM